MLLERTQNLITTSVRNVRVPGKNFRRVTDAERIAANMNSTKPVSPWRNVTRELRNQVKPVAGLELGPYERPKKKSGDACAGASFIHRCLLCEKGIEVDYKNPRLLSQFISSFTGRTYGKHVTRLCEFQHKKVLNAIMLSRSMGYMPVLAKNPRYLNDPKLFDPMRPIRPNPF